MSMKTKHLQIYFNPTFWNIFPEMSRCVKFWFYKKSVAVSIDIAILIAWEFEKAIPRCGNENTYVTYFISNGRKLIHFSLNINVKIGVWRSPYNFPPAHVVCAFQNIKSSIASAEGFHSASVSVLNPFITRNVFQININEIV